MTPHAMGEAAVRMDYAMGTFAAALSQAGIAYADAIAWLVADARRRASTRP
jgi:hypothetical protein